MKKTICKCEYDTEKSDLVKKLANGVYGDPKGYEESLYRTPTGAYFLYVNGGAESIYPAEDIKRMSKAKAEAWLAEHRDA